MQEYDKKYLLQCLLGLFGMAGLMWVIGEWGFAVMIPIFAASIASRKPENLLFALMLMIALTMGNGNIMPKRGTFMVLQRSMTLILSVVMFARVMGQRHSPLLKPLLSLLFYWVFMFVPSAKGWCPIISYMKLAFFIGVFCAYYGVTNGVANNPHADGRKVRSVFLAFATFFILGSMVLMPFPGLSMMNAEMVQEALSRGVEFTSLYCGITLHSQMLGPIIAALGVFLFADLLIGVRRSDKLYLLLLLCTPVLIWKTSSRTAMGAFIVGICFVMYCFLKMKGVRMAWKSRVTSMMLMLVAFFSIGVLCVPAMQKSAMSFALKFNKDEERAVTFEEVTKTRQGTWDSAIANFKKSPAIGNGFQVSEEFAGRQIDNPLKVLSAPVEKGTWVSAILEEGGVFGMILFLVFVCKVYFSLSRQRAYVGLTAFFMLLVINLGEFTIFSMTATGGLLWALVFVGLTMDAKRLQSEPFGRSS